MKDSTFLMSTWMKVKIVLQAINVVCYFLEFHFLEVFLVRVRVAMVGEVGKPPERRMKEKPKRQRMGKSPFEGNQK